MSNKWGVAKEDLALLYCFAHHFYWDDDRYDNLI